MGRKSNAAIEASLKQASQLSSDIRLMPRQVILEFVAQMAAGACLGHNISAEVFVKAFKEAHTGLLANPKLAELRDTLRIVEPPARDTAPPITPLDYLPAKEPTR